MIAVLTGDIIGSRKNVNAKQWLTPLREALNAMGKNPATWEIFQGDSFQVETTVQKSLEQALFLKASVKAIANLDVRIAIGLGDKTHKAKTIAEANGTAFVYSGETLNTLKSKKQNLMVKSDFSSFDETINLMLKLALIGMDNWTTGAAEITKISLLNPNWNQSKLAKQLGITQPSVSQRQKTAHYNELMALNAYYHTRLANLMEP